ncbi:MAG: hypothetical protein NC306_15125 [Butyrivibrio sp.]|nr:hypothetical protein [Butyrivibrio sp.]
MVEKSRYGCRLLEEFDSGRMEHWFGFKKQKFLHNIDTFYYSVKFRNDFRYESKDENVQKLRKFFRLKYDYLQQHDETDDFYIPQLGKYLVLKPVTFSRFYSVCLSYPEYFDIFLAPVVPRAADGGESVTCECIVQIRSYMLWQFGVRDCFENSYEYVKKIAEFFGLEIYFVQENRVDYCWHTNYLSNPEAFFSPDNFYKMRVDRFKNATYVTNKVGAEDYEIDYVSLGKRSDKVFIRIYQKTREVIEQNYKPWFLKIWQMHGLINRYDQYVYEKAYEHKSWHYRFFARLEFYLEHGSDPDSLERCRKILDGDVEIEENDLIRLADELTPRLNYVINVEYQTMRRHSKSYDLVPFKDHRNKGNTKRIYDYLDNRRLITDYLTDKVFRMVVHDPHIKKSEREMCAFWQALRRTKCLDMKMTKESIKLTRSYNRRLNKDAVKKRFINAAVTYGLYSRGENADNPLQDAFEVMLRMNDNDLHNARKFKTKRLRQLNREELAGVFEGTDLHRFRILDENTGVLYDYDTLSQMNLQGGNEDDDDHPPES